MTLIRLLLWNECSQGKSIKKHLNIEFLSTSVKTINLLTIAFLHIPMPRYPLRISTLETFSVIL